ncbi:Lrp/AsnC ligand binding domain-containing protein [Oceanicola sp. S124]|uniref:Lrp/AsnC ligand binding domain-containing protein n=1 Tax=Oceanicola sp. S124 TaxID=1042378 RepID=UPI0002557AA6|nr:Lrp/AsnC ligand binding domain-containing protein [Oceanicola sp. S124]
MLTCPVVDTGSCKATRDLPAFAHRPGVEDLHTLAGEGCVLVKGLAIDTDSLDDFLMEIQSLEGLRSARSYITPSTFLETWPLPA